MVKKISIETLISRAPSLFPFIKKDEYGITHMHSALESVDACYNKVIPNFIIDINGKKYVKSFYDIKKIFYEKDFTDINLYEKIKDGFGIFEVNNDIYGSLVPKYVSYPLINKWIKWFDSYISSCDNYENNGNISECCACNEFNERGGMKMYIFLKDIYKKCFNIANEWYNFALNFYKENNEYGFISINVSLSSFIDDIGIESCYAKEWIPKKGYNSGDIVIYNENTYILGGGFEGENKNYGVYDENSNTVLFDFNNWNIIKESPNSHGKEEDGTINFSTNSKLTSLRRTKRYIFTDNDEEILDIPSDLDNHDMLCLYQKGLILNIQTIVDEDGNIAYYGDNESFFLNKNENLTDASNENIKFLSERNDLSVDEYEDYSNNLIAYGDAITDIYFDNDNKELIFEYCIGAHLKGNGISVSNGNNIFSNKKYLFSNFIIDENFNGIKYVDKYKIEEDFKYDINKTPEENINDGNYGYFNTTFSKTDLIKEFSNQSLVNTERMVYNAESDLSRNDVIYSQNIRKNEFLGVTFEPIVEKEVLVDRGINSAFEKHIKLGEIKTIEDLENFSNGSFFNIKTVE